MLVKGLIEFLNDPLLIFNPLINMINGVIGVINDFLNFMFGGLIEPINSIVGFINGGITNLENTINGLFGLFAGEEGVDEEEKQYFLESQKHQSHRYQRYLYSNQKRKGKRKNKSKVCLVVDRSPTLIHTMVVVSSLVVLVRPSQVWDLTLN